MQKRVHQIIFHQQLLPYLVLFIVELPPIRISYGKFITPVYTMQAIEGYTYVCVCVFFPFILDIKFVGRTSRGHTGGRSHRISHPPSFCGACLNFSREKDSATLFPRRPCSQMLCTNDLIVLHPLGIFIFILVYFCKKNPFAGIELTSQRVRRLHGNL